MATALDSPSSSYEAVILDDRIPGMDGDSIARWFLASLAEGLLIAPSGYGRQKNLEQSRTAEVDHYLMKPAGAEILKRLIE